MWSSRVRPLSSVGIEAFLRQKLALLQQHEQFTTASNAPIELIGAGKLDEAKAAGARSN